MSLSALGDASILLAPGLSIFVPSLVIINLTHQRESPDQLTPPMPVPFGQWFPPNLSQSNETPGFDTNEFLHLHGSSLVFAFLVYT